MQEAVPALLHGCVQSALSKAIRIGFSNFKAAETNGLPAVMGDAWYWESFTGIDPIQRYPQKASNRMLETNPLKSVIFEFAKSISSIYVG